MAKLLSQQTPLSFLEWKYLHRSRLDLLPLVGYPWSGMEDKSCRHCHRENENGFHVLNHCRMNLVLATKQHNVILNLLDQLVGDTEMDSKTWVSKNNFYIFIV